MVVEAHILESMDHVETATGEFVLKVLMSFLSKTKKIHQTEKATSTQFKAFYVLSRYDF